MQIKDMDEVSTALLNTSFLQRLFEKIKTLKKENRSLKNLICSIPEFRCNCSSNKKVVKRCPLRKDVDPVHIKEEIIKDKENIRMRLDEVEFIENRFKNVSLVDLVDDDDEEVEVEVEPKVVVKKEVIVEPKVVDKKVKVVVEEVVVEEVVVEEVEVEEEEDEVEVEEVEVEEEEEEVEVEEVEVEEEEEEVEVEEVEVEEEEEEEEVEEEEVEVVVEEKVEEVVVEEEVEEEESEESEVFEITIGKKVYYTNNEINGTIYTVGQDEDVGDEVGSFVNGKPVFTVKQ
jgi:hypothetical protein